MFSVKVAILGHPPFFQADGVVADAELTAVLKELEDQS